MSHMLSSVEAFPGLRRCPTAVEYAVMLALIVVDLLGRHHHRHNANTTFNKVARPSSQRGFNANLPLRYDCRAELRDDWVVPFLFSNAGRRSSDQATGCHRANRIGGSLRVLIRGPITSRGALRF